jgi:hypothetical protein
MEFLRKSTISGACCVLFISLTFFGTALAARQVIGRPAPIESALRQTNAYSTVVTDFIESHQGNTTIGVPLTIPAVQTALLRAFPQSVVEPAINQLISGTYAWAQGKTTTLDFRIDLTGARINFANYIQEAAEQQAAKLPTCPDNQSPNPQLILQNPLAITCLPAQLSPTIVGNYARQAILSSSFLQDPVLTPANFHLVSSDQLKLPTQTAGPWSPPHLYRQLMESIYVSVAVSIVCISLIIWLHRDRRKGLGRAGVTIGAAGITCIITAMITGEISRLLASHDKVGSLVGQQITTVLQQTVTKVVTILAKDLHQWLLEYGIILTIVGAGTWVSMLIWQRKQSKANTPTEASTPTIPNSSVSIT